MPVTIVDWRENELKVGDKVVFGSPDTPDEILNQIGTIIVIGEPDVKYNPVTDADDGGYGLEIQVVFEDGSVEKVEANYRSGDDHEEIFEASDDIVFAADKHHVHTHTIRNGKPVCVYCGEEMEL